MPLLFVYGTLMYGLSAHELLVGSDFAGRGYVRGSLYLCDGYPLLVLDGEGVVWGELYHVDAARLSHIDHYEGADTGSPWSRVRVEVVIDDVHVWAYAYASRRDTVEKLCSVAEELDVDDYGVVVGRRRARWLVAVGEGVQPPGIHLGVDTGFVDGFHWSGYCFDEDGGEDILLYDLLALREELEEWARGLGCRLSGLIVRRSGIPVYPYAPLAGGVEG